MVHRTSPFGGNEGWHLQQFMDLVGFSAPTTMPPTTPWTGTDVLASGPQFTGMSSFGGAPLNPFMMLTAIGMAMMLMEFLQSGSATSRDVGQLGGQNYDQPPRPTSWNPTTASSSVPVGQGVQGLDVHVIGDSLMVGAQARTKSALREAGARDVSIDAAGGRRLTASGDAHHMSPAEIRRSVEASGADVVVLELGSNHGDYERFVPETMEQLSQLRPPPQVVWVNTQTQRPNTTSYGQSYYDGNAAINRVIADEAARRPNMTIANWSQIAGSPGINGSDGLHLTGAGNDALAELILQTVSGLPRTR